MGAQPRPRQPPARGSCCHPGSRVAVGVRRGAAGCGGASQGKGHWEQGREEKLLLSVF